MASGWIRLYRQIQESDLWDAENGPFDVRSAWIDLLLMANHSDKKILFGNKAMIVKAGQRVTSILQLAERWHWSRGRVTRYLDKLQNEGMLTRESSNTKTLITITNYCIFQSPNMNGDTTDEATDRATHGATDGQLMEQLTDTNKNDKNNKNDKKSVYGEFAHVRLSDPEHQKLIDEYGEEMTAASITFLDEYIEMKGYKAKSHYLCIKKWVVDAVKERRTKKKQVNNDTWSINSDDAYTDIIAALEGKK